jgi:hypothetical protein
MLCKVTVLAFALTAALAASASAATAVDYEDGVFRLRADPRGNQYVDLQVVGKPGGPNERFVAHMFPFVQVGPGCDLTPDPAMSRDEVDCAIVGPAAIPRYRLTLTDSADIASVDLDAHGVVYSGAGQDTIDADRIFGGGGDDDLTGRNIYGGPGRDSINSGTSGFVRGGTGGDRIGGARRQYGGPGHDVLEEGVGSGDMLVGGPGHDRINMWGHDNSRDVVRLRGGSRDVLDCFERLDPQDVLYVDRTDRVRPTCRNARVVLTGPPHL